MKLLVLMLLTHVELDGAAQVAGFPLAAGGFVRGVAGAEVWGTPEHGGRLEAGVQLGHDFQPYQWVGYLGAGEQLAGGEHRTHLWLVAGHTAHRGRFSLGLHALGGLSHHLISGTFTNAGESISGAFTTSHALFAFGLAFKLAALIGQRWGLALHATGFPLGSTWSATGYFSVGLGLFLRL